MSAVLTGIFGALIGAWINNVFTWKVKSKVDAIDSLYSGLWKLDDFFHKFIGLKFDGADNEKILRI